jgi:exoribonuclease R
MEQSRWRLLSSTSQEVRAAFDAIRKEAGVPESVPPEVAEVAARAASKILDNTYVDRREIEFVTIDPPSSMDLDQAVHIERREGGFRVHYAIADVAFWVEPGSLLDDEVHRRGLTIYGPDMRVGLHPVVLSEDAASLLPGQDRPAALWTIDLDEKGEIVTAAVVRSLVRSRAKLSYEQVQFMLDDGSAAESLQLVREVGELRLALERARGGVSLEVPEQEVRETDSGDFVLLFRSTLPIEKWNAQISLLTGIAAAQMMLAEGVGILRTLPPAAPRDLAKLRATAKALGIKWRRGESYAELLRTLDASNPKHAAFMTRATTLFRGAGYLAFDHTASYGGSPAAVTNDEGVDVGDAEGFEVASSTGGDLNLNRRHAAIAAEYAHVTAPLRRLVDRYGTEICLAHTAGTTVPQWVLEKLPLLPAEMTAANRVANRVERETANIVEASLLQHRIGETFDGVIVDVLEKRDKPSTRGEVMISDPAVLARIDGEYLVLGEEVTARLVEAVVSEGKVRFELA